MGGAKHGPNRFDRYLAIHDTIMAKFASDGFVEDDGVVFSDLGAGEILVEGKIQCVGGICIRVIKTLAVVSGVRAEALVRTTSYSYNVFADGIGNVFRYCSPHDTEEQPDHKPFHHKHVYDLLAGDVTGRVEEVGDDAWPTLGEVIEQARDWYHHNVTELDLLRARYGQK